MSERPGDQDLYEEAIGEKKRSYPEGDLEAFQRLCDKWKDRNSKDRAVPKS